MAKAPTPGIGKRLEISQETDDELSSGFRISCEAEGKDVEFLMGDLSVDAIQTCRQQTGFPPQAYFTSSPDITTVLVLYWLGRRKAGEQRLTFDQVTRKWGDPRSFREGGFAIDALGPLFEDNEEDEEEEAGPPVQLEGGADPTPSEGPSEPPGPSGPRGTASTLGMSAESDGSPVSSSAPTDGP